MNVSNFRLEVKLATPVILQGYLTLESLLAAAVYQETGEMQDAALSKVPIESSPTPAGQLWHASSFFYGSPPRFTPHTIIRRRRRDEIGAAFYDPNPRMRKDPYGITQGAGDYKALLNEYRSTIVESLVWYATGDAQKCIDLALALGAIGKRRGEGFGEIAGVSVQATQANPLVADNGTVMRPIPESMLAFLPGATSLQRFENVVDRHPGWLHNPVKCAVPPNRIDDHHGAHTIVGEYGEEFYA